MSDFMRVSTTKWGFAQPMVVKAKLPIMKSLHSDPTNSMVADCPASAHGQQRLCRRPAGGGPGTVAEANTSKFGTGIFFLAASESHLLFTNERNKQ
jgi:hypothetical protein